MILKKIKNIVRWVVVLFFSTTILAVVAYRFIPVYFTPLMFIRCFQQVADGESIIIIGFRWIRFLPTCLWR
jgi:monofunctional biosynthetic peptidoglycan transglycosylase